jgi:DNA (cytosine-5)-methyltransferase 1
MGYHRVGFDVAGVDIAPQGNYPFPLIQGDALAYIAAHGHEYDAIHASPPCQAFSLTQRIRGNSHLDLVGPIRNLLQASARPYVIENVPGAPLIDPVTLVGTMFGLRTVRARLFECSFDLPFTLAPPPSNKHAKMGRPAKPGEYSHVVGHTGVTGMKVEWERAMGIDWMTGDGLAQAIPPAYTEYIGRYLLDHLTAKATP